MDYFVCSLKCLWVDYTHLTAHGSNLLLAPWVSEQHKHLSILSLFSFLFLITEQQLVQNECSTVAMVSSFC